MWGGGKEEGERGRDRGGRGRTTREEERIEERGVEIEGDRRRERQRERSCLFFAIVSDVMFERTKQNI